MLKRISILIVASIFCLLAYSKLSALQAQPSKELSQWRNEANTHFFKDNKISFHDSKTPDRPVMVLMHGYPTSSWDWRFVWNELKDDFRLVSLDMLGFGLSDKPNNIRYTITEQTDIYESLLRSLSIDEAHFVAHDYGDIVAQELLARQESGTWLKMQSLVLLNGAIFPEVHNAMFVQKLLDSRAGNILSHFNSRLTFSLSLKKVFGEFSRPTEVILNDYWFLSVYNDGHLLNPRLLHYIDDRHTNRDRWVGATVKTKVPMLFINGVSDPVAGKKMVDRYIELVNEPNVVRLDGIGHFPHVEAPKEVSAGIVFFLSTLSSY